uniref:Uncharacterized protein n=1 Tax=Anguilla anguilla TaxID=7936 RepID=A0A0E9XA86_ANGAN
METLWQHVFNCTDISVKVKS